jgi:hypothetical protein
MNNNWNGRTASSVCGCDRADLNYKVRAELGTLPAARLLTEQAFRIVGGQQSDVVLSIAGLSPAKQVEVVVTLRFDSRWSLEAFALQLYSLDVVVNHRYRTQKVSSSSMSSPVAGTWTSQPILLEVGRTRFLSDELHFSSEQVVEPLERQEILIEVPAPGRVLVRALDGSSGKSFDGARFRWGCKQEGQKAAFFGEESRPQTAVGEYEFLAPCGTIEVEATSGQHLFASQALEVGPGFNEVTLVLEADYCVEFVLHEGEQLVPWSMSAGMAVQFEPLEAQVFRGTSGTNLGSGRMTHYRKVGGRYRVVFPKLPGYRQVEPFEFDFEQRGTVEKSVQLVRE